MPKDVYIGQGKAFEIAAGLGAELMLQQNITGPNLAVNRGFLAQYLIDICRPLEPTEMFVIYSGGNPPRLFSARRDVNSTESIFRQAKPYSPVQLREYLESNMGAEGQIIKDHIIVTTTDLVERVESEIKKLGLNPIKID